jgi:hypothetical protein
MYIILMNPIIIPLFIALVIILHHYKKHSSNPNFTLLEKFVQINDINNHETWAIFFIGISIGMLIMKYLLYTKYNTKQYSKA